MAQVDLDRRFRKPFHFITYAFLRTCLPKVAIVQLARGISVARASCLERINILVLHVHKKLTAKGVLEYFVDKRDSGITEINLFLCLILRAS
jgi:hypothetical protein